MYRIYSTLIEILAAAVFMVPIWCIYQKIYFHDWKRTIVSMIFGFYLTAIFSLVGFPTIRFLRINFTLNIIPFITMVSDYVNAWLNVLLFIPFGFFLPILWSRFQNIKNVVLIGLIATCMIEMSQIFTYRATDINDIITNMMGTIIGYFTARWITNNFTKRILPGSSNRDFYVICGLVVLIMFFFQPFVSLILWEMVL